MSQRLVQAFRSTRIAIRRRSNSFLYLPYSRPILTFAFYSSSSLASHTPPDQGSKINQGESYPRIPLQNRVELQSDDWQLVDSDGSKIRQEKSELDTKSTEDNGIHLEDTSTISREDRNHNQGTSTQQHFAIDYEPMAVQSSEYGLDSSPTAPASSRNTISETPTTSNSSNSANSDGDQELQIGGTQESRKTHFLDAIQRRDGINIREKPMFNSYRKALVHDRLRSKDTWSFDWSVPLFRLRDALPQQKAKAPRESPWLNLASRLEKVNLINNDYMDLPVSFIPVPKVWTKASFAQHVHDLCRSRMPRQLETSVNGQKAVSHQTMVRKRLEEVMFVPENAKLMSFAAFESAMRFFYLFEMLPSVQNLYFYVRKIGYPFPDGIVDIILRHAAMDKDLHNFTSMLHGALTQGFVPSEMTWASLLSCLVSPKSQKVVLDMMHKHKLLEQKQTRQDVVSVELEMKLSSLSNLSKVEKLIDRMDAQYGQDWFTIRSANTLLGQLCKLPPGQPITDFLDLMSKRGYLPDINSMNILLQRCSYITDLEAALTVFGHFAGRHRVVPDQKSYNLLFKTAWNARHVNTCKVLWAAACMHKRTTHSMKKLIKTSLLKPKPASISHAWHRWGWQAGKLIVGVEPRIFESRHGRILLQPIKLGMRPSSLVNMKAAIISNPEDDKADASAKALVQHDESLYSRFYYALHAIKSDLTLAYEMDQKWKATGINKSSLEHQMESIMAIQVSRRNLRPAADLENID